VLGSTQVSVGSTLLFAIAPRLVSAQFGFSTEFLFSSCSLSTLGSCEPYRLLQLGPFPSLAMPVSAGSYVFIGFNSRDEMFGQSQARLTFSTDNGSNFVPPFNVSSGSSVSFSMEEIVASASNTHLLVVYSSLSNESFIYAIPIKIHSRVYDIAKGSFSSELLIPPPTADGNCSRPSVAAGPGVSFIIVYQCGGNQTLNIYYSTLDFVAETSTWTSPVPITTALPNSEVTDYMETDVAYDGSSTFVAIFSAPPIDAGIIFRDLYTSCTNSLHSKFIYHDHFHMELN